MKGGKDDHDKHKYDQTNNKGYAEGTTDAKAKTVSGEEG